MAEKPPRDMVPSDGGFFHELSLRIRLILRLMKDRRVSPFLKLLPIGSLVYLFFPDLVIGPLDDAMVIWLGGYLFIELCPPQVVEEHLNELRRVIPANWRDPDEAANTVEGEYNEVKEPPIENPLLKENKTK